MSHEDDLYETRRGKAFLEWWESLTPEEQAEEIVMQDLHATEGWKP